MRLHTLNGLSLLDYISIIHDYPQSRKTSYSLADIFFLTFTSIIGGAEVWDEIAGFEAGENRGKFE